MIVFIANALKTVKQSNEIEKPREEAKFALYWVARNLTSEKVRFALRSKYEKRAL